MPIVLVIDDSATDRLLIGGLLKPKLDWIVQFAEDGSEGLQMIGEIFPDVVVTDLQMPELNGIQLCAEAKAEYPHVPIILVTGQGSEELAVEALQAGATSYVPKTGLSQYLLDTVEQVLALSQHDQSKVRLMQNTTGVRYQFNLELDQALISPLVDFVSSTMASLGIGDESDQRHVSVAIEEALINAMFHGNLELDSAAALHARQRMHDGGISEDVVERQVLSPYKERRVQVAINLNRKQIEIAIRDEGAGFNASVCTEHASEPSQLSSQEGRGLTLIHNFMDHVSFNDSANEIRMCMKVKAAAKKPAAAR